MTAEQPVNTGENRGRFKKGDKRINRKGRPRSFDALRKLAQAVLAEAIETGDGEAVTRIEAMLKLMSSSRNPADRKTLLEYAYGKPKEEIDVTSGGEKIKGYVTFDPAQWDAEEKKPKE